MNRYFDNPTMKLYKDKRHLLPLNKNMSFHDDMTINEVIEHLKRRDCTHADISLFFNEYGFNETYIAYQVVDYLVKYNLGD